MAARKDLPRCKTCKHWYVNEYTGRANGYCVNSTNPELDDVPEDFGCLNHSDYSDYDEPETQTETNDDYRVLANALSVVGTKSNLLLLFPLEVWKAVGVDWVSAHRGIEELIGSAIMYENAVDWYLGTQRAETGV